MAAYSPQALTHTYKAAVDLSNYQYRLMKAGSVAGECSPATAGASCIGVLQNDPVATEAALVVVWGFSKVQVDCEGSASPVTFGGYLKAASNAMAQGFISAGASTFTVGRAEEAVASGSGVYIEMFVAPQRYI